MERPATRDEGLLCVVPLPCVVESLLPCVDKSLFVCALVDTSAEGKLAKNALARDLARPVAMSVARLVS